MKGACHKLEKGSRRQWAWLFGNRCRPKGDVAAHACRVCADNPAQSQSSLLEGGGPRAKDKDGRGGTMEARHTSHSQYLEELLTDKLDSGVKFM